MCGCGTNSSTSWFRRKLESCEVRCVSLLFCGFGLALHFAWCWRLAEVLEAAVEEIAAAGVTARPQILRRRRKLCLKLTCRWWCRPRRPQRNQTPWPSPWLIAWDAFSQSTSAHRRRPRHREILARRFLPLIWRWRWLVLALSSATIRRRFLRARCGLSAAYIFRRAL